MSWSWPKTTKLWGYPVDGITLRDGAVVAAYSYRTKPMGVRIAARREHMVPGRCIHARVVRPREGASGVPHLGGRAAQLDYSARHALAHRISKPILLDDGSVFTGYHLFNASGRQYVEGAIYRIEKK